MSLPAAIAELQREDCNAKRLACYRKLVEETVRVSPGITSGPDLKSAMMVYAECPVERYEPNVALESMSGFAFVQSAFDRKCGFFLMHHSKAGDVHAVYIKQSEVGDILAHTRAT